MTSNCIPISAESRTFYYFSTAVDAHYLVSKLKNGRINNLGNHVFYSLPPFQKSVKNENGNVQLLIPSYKYTSLNMDSLRRGNTSSICVPEVNHLSTEKFELMYAFNADEYHQGVSVLGSRFTVSEAVMFGFVSFVDLEHSFHVTQFDVTSNCDVAFFLFSVANETGRVPYMLYKG